MQTLTVPRRKHRRPKPSLDLLDEGPMLLSVLRFQIPGKPSYESLRQWCTSGKVIRDSRVVVVMESVLIPGGRASSVAAYKRFVTRLNGVV